MRNYWRRFAAWGTGLKNDPFLWARLKLTSLYTICVVVAFFITNIALLRLWFATLQQVIPGSLDAQVRQELILRLNDEISRLGLTVYALVLLAIIAISFAVSGRTLSPIHRIMRAQKRFIADASHELRTPLAIMKTNSEVALLDGDHINPLEAQATLKSNLQEIDRMSKIIENLLALSYYDNNYAVIPFQEVSLSKITSEISEKIRSLAQRKSIDLRILNNDPGIILGNPVAIEQMIMNLIKNAITYTSEGGTVSVSVIAKITVMEFKVKDTGIGISKKDLPNVFNPFYKAGRTRVQTERESSGLGLSIVKKIVERHDGSIYINSMIDKGTTIIVTLPRHQTENLPDTRRSTS